MPDQAAESPIRRWPITTAVVIVLISTAVTLTIAEQNVDDELKKALYTGAIGLLFVGLLGGIVKLLFDESAKATRYRVEAADFTRNLLSDLKSVYDRVGRARILIAAHQSAKTYGSEMRDLIDARVKLRNVGRALMGGADGLSAEAATTLSEQVDSMERYLESLLKEFSTRYGRISEMQRAHESRVDARVKAFASSEDRELKEIENLPWQRITALPLLHDFLDEEATYYSAAFEEPLDRASAVLREELTRIVSGKPAMAGKRAPPPRADEARSGSLSSDGTVVAPGATVAGDRATSIKTPQQGTVGMPELSRDRQPRTP